MALPNPHRTLPRLCFQIAKVTKHQRHFRLCSSSQLFLPANRENSLHTCAKWQHRSSQPFCPVNRENSPHTCAKWQHRLSNLRRQTFRRTDHPRNYATASDSDSESSFLKADSNDVLSLKNYSTSDVSSYSDLKSFLNSDSNDILSLKNLPLYQFVRKTIRDKSIPEIHVNSLQLLLTRFDKAVAELLAASQLDRDARVRAEIACTDTLYETQSEALDLLLKHVAEFGTETQFDSNVAYVDLVPKYRGLGSRNALKLREEILEMYFHLAEQKKWDLTVIAHHDNHSCVRVRGKSAYHLMRCETGVHESKSPSPWSSSFSVDIVVRPHFKSKHLPEVASDQISTLSVEAPAVHVEHIPTKMKAESSEHSTIVRNRADALLSLRQKMAAETWFDEKERLPSEANSSTAMNRNQLDLFHRYLAPPLFTRKNVIRIIDPQKKLVVDKRISQVNDESLIASSSSTPSSSTPSSPSSESTLIPFPMPTDESERALLSPSNISFIQERLLLAHRRSLLEQKIRDSYLQDNSDEVVDSCRLRVGALLGGDGGRCGGGGEEGESPLLRAKCEELDRLKERLGEAEELLKMTKAESEEKNRQCERLAEKLRDKEAFLEKLTKGKRDLSEVLKAEGERMRAQEESNKDSFFKSLRRKESSLESLIDKRYSDRIDLSQDKFQVQSQLDRALSLIEKQQKDLKESGVRVNELTVQLGHLRNVLENKDRKVQELDSVITSFRRNADRSQLLQQLEAAEAEAAKRVAEAEEAKAVAAGERSKAEKLASEVNEMEGMMKASSEREKAKIEFLEMTVENLQTALVTREMDVKQELEKERSNVETMKRQMRDYIKKHAQSSMDKEMAVVKLEKDVDVLKKEVEMSGKREEALQAALNRERSGRDHANYLQEEEKRAWVGEWERSKEEERKQWQTVEKNLRERLHRLESENKDAKDTIENLIAFQQRKNRHE